MLIAAAGWWLPLQTDHPAHLSTVNMQMQDQLLAVERQSNEYRRRAKELETEKTQLQHRNAEHLRTLTRTRDTLEEQAQRRFHSYNQQLVELEGKLRSTDQQLGQMHEQLRSAQQELTEMRENVRARDQILAQAQERTQPLNQQLADVQGQHRLMPREQPSLQEPAAKQRQQLASCAETTQRSSASVITNWTEQYFRAKHGRNTPAFEAPAKAAHRPDGKQVYPEVSRIQ